MSQLAAIYRHSLALLTDLYQLTMGYGYWKHGLAEREAVFCLSFRSLPFGGGHAIACGLRGVVDFLQQFAFEAGDLAYLATLRGADNRPLFQAEFLEWLGGQGFRCDVDAIPEGTAVFAHEPLVRVRGPLLQAQLLETPLLNLVNFPTLVATKAARICRAAAGQPVLEFGLRRAQGIDGGLSASRAAFVGGCAATSHLLAGKLYGIPVRGTHAHSWVMAFGDERAAFHAYCDALPGNAILLVDTFETRAGVEHAIDAAGRLHRQGHRLLGIRLDSGDLLALSREARRQLDDAGFADAVIVASGDLDEYEITRLRREGAPIGVWGVGTRLATAYDQPALGGVYKLAAIRSPSGAWEDRVKRSDEEAKSTTPGFQQVRRFADLNGRFAGDVVYDERDGGPGEPRMISVDGQAIEAVSAAAGFEDLLVPVFRAGRAVYDPPSAEQARRRTQQQLDALGPDVTRLESPSRYPVGLTPALHRRRQQAMAELEQQLREAPR